jgi:membrane-associated protein
MDLHAILYAFKHLDETIDHLTQAYGSSTYVILGLVVFCETGLVVTPFLPGDSLLFAIGAISMRDGSGLNPVVAAAVLITAALLGDNVNYRIGKAIGPRVMSSETSRIFNKKHLVKTHAFYEKYGPKAIILARFVPIVRTFSPFVAGAGAMTFRRFLAFSATGAVLWVTTMMGAGVVFGQTKFVKEHFDVVVVAIVLISVLPMFIEYFKSRGKGSAAAAS